MWYGIHWKWSSLDMRATRNLDKIDHALKATLKRNKTSLCIITFNKGTTTNINKDINFFYYWM